MAQDSGNVPAIGWDYGHTTGQNNIQHYPLSGSLTANSFISITLAWDRHVEFDNDVNANGMYDPGDTFQASTASFPTPDSDEFINDLEVYLVPKGSATINQAVAESISPDGTLEHIFFQIQTTDEYEIWVRQFDQESFSASQDYALAWWYGVAPPLLAGDYSGDEIVDSQDYSAWRGAFGNSGTEDTSADGNGNGVIDAGDYVVWRKNSVVSGSGSSLASVPEPSAICLAFVGVAVLLCARKKPTPHDSVTYTVSHYLSPARQIECQILAQLRGRLQRYAPLAADESIDNRL